MIQTHDRIIIKLPYPVKILGLKFYIKRKIGFLFTNRANILFAQENELEDSAQYNKWVKVNGQAKLISEIFYYAAVSYGEHMRIKDNFTKEGLFEAFRVADEPTQRRILRAWEQSKTFGRSHEPDKKKVRTTRAKTR